MTVALKPRARTNVGSRVISLNVLHAEVPDVGGSMPFTSIDKRSVEGSRLVTSDGIMGDQRSDMKHHGSPDQAVYAYSDEDYGWWSVEIDQTLTPGKFGENLTTTGVDLNNLVIGTVVKVGSAKLKVTKPRIPCATFGRWMKQDQWVKRFSDAERVGAYLGVIESGEITAGDEFEIESVPNHGVTILDYLKVHTGDRDPVRVANLVACPDLSEEAREKFAKCTVTN